MCEDRTDIIYTILAIVKLQPVHNAEQILPHMQNAIKMYIVDSDGMEDDGDPFTYYFQPTSVTIN